MYTENYVLCVPVFLVQMPVSSRAWTSYGESCGLSILSKVMTGWQRNCCVHLPCSKPLYLLWKGAFNLIKCVWVQGGIQYSHMLNVLTKHQWVGEELRKDMKVLMLTEWNYLCLCVCSAHFTFTEVHVFAFAPAYATPLYAGLCGYVFVCAFSMSVCEWAFCSSRNVSFCVCGVTAIKYF